MNAKQGVGGGGGGRVRAETGQIEGVENDESVDVITRTETNRNR